jgi:hypothetical protein
MKACSKHGSLLAVSGRTSAHLIGLVWAEADLVSVERLSAINPAGPDRKDDLAIVAEFKLGFVQRLVIDGERISRSSRRADFYVHTTLPCFWDRKNANMKKKFPHPDDKKAATEPGCHAMSRRPGDEAAIGVDALSG